MGDQDHRLRDTLHVGRRAGTGIHEPSGCVRILHPKQEWYFTRRTLVILGVTPPGVLQGGPPCSWGLESFPLPGGAILAEDMENPRVKVSCVRTAGAISIPVTHGLGMALCPSQEMGLCSRVVFASTASDTANLSAGRSVPSSSQPTPTTWALGYAASTSIPVSGHPKKSCWWFVVALNLWLQDFFGSPSVAVHIHNVGLWDGIGPCVAATFLLQGKDVPGRGQSLWHPKCASVRAWLAASKHA